ncbi:MAG: PAS domain S-box protein [Aliidongia sp.]
MQQLLASVFMSVDAPVAIIALDGRFIAVNPAFSQMLRYGARGLEGHRFWDLISEEFGGNVAVDATESGKSGAAYAVDARIRLGDGSTATLRVSLTSIRQPQFKRFRLLAIREVSAPSAATPPSSFSTPNLREVVVAGNIQLVGLDLVKAALGKRWPAHAEKAMLVAEAILRNRLGPEDVFSRTEDRGFVICFAEGSEDAAAFRAAIIAREIRNRLIGDSDDPAGSSVTAVTLAVEIGPDQTENGRPVLSVLQQRLEAARSEAERRAAAELSVAMAVATLEPEPVFDNVGKSVPIVFVSLPGTLQEQIDVALATLPSTEGIDADLDVLKLTLSAEAALADIGAGRSAIYLLPVHFALFANRKRQERYVEICRKLQDIVRQRIIFMLSEVPRTASQSRLFEMIRLLKPFGKGVGMDLDSAEFIPTDLAQYRIPLVALSADELLDSARTSPSKLSRFIRQLRLNGTRLIARQVRGEAERSAVVSIGADLVSFTTRGGRTDSPLEQTPQNNLESWAFAAAIKSTKVAVVITNMKKPDNPITSCNPAFSEITGYTSEEVVGHNWRVLHGRGTDRGVVDEIREAVLGGAPIERELLMYRKDGTSILCNLVISPVHDDAGALVATVGLVTDVTALRRAEASRRAIARLFDDLVENIPGYIFQRTLTADGRAEYNYLSPSFKRLVGAPVGEPLRKPHPEWIHPDDAQAVSQAIQMSGEHLTPVTLEYRLICDDGQIRWVRTRSRPGRREDGTVVWNGVGWIYRRRRVRRAMFRTSPDMMRSPAWPIVNGSTADCAKSSQRPRRKADISPSCASICRTFGN